MGTWGRALADRRRARLSCANKAAVDRSTPSMPGRSAGPIVLVTGASGHIGSTLCSLLRAAGREVLAVDVQAHAQERIEPCDVKSNDRSEEHTSELQSRLHLVCRLLLEKKKKIISYTIEYT